ncbi:hypothetical protein V1478_013528 [Vespula squamosa]|uniref:Uncharacterized protein n=1 Tax=Vespula squamosa TaxID=30214 RepID=A0ABD2A692_VESSQ
MQYAYNDILLLFDFYKRKQTKSNIIFPRQQVVILLPVFISCQLFNTSYFLPLNLYFNNRFAYL